MYYFEISNFSLSKSLFSGGDEVIANFTLKNIAVGPGDGQKKEIWAPWFVLKSTDTGARGAEVSEKVKLDNVTLSYGKSMQFTVTFKLKDVYTESLDDFFEENPNKRTIMVGMGIHASYEESGWAVDATDTYETTALFLRSYCKPQIPAFELSRAINGTPSDEGQDVLSTVKLALADQRNIPALSLFLHYAENGEASTDSAYIDLTGQIQSLLSGVADSTELIFRQFSNGSNWDFLLFFGDEYESVTAKQSFARAFANLHLSGAKTGGACFGGFSSSTEGDPKLESYFPGYFYSGIHGVNIFSYQEVKTGGRWADNKPLYTKVLVMTDAAKGTLHDIDVPEDVETLWIDQSASFSINSNGYIYPIGYMTSDNVRAFVAAYQPSIKKVRAGTYTGSTADFYVKIYYTKTTDQPIEPVQTHAQMVDADDLPVTDKNGLSFYAEEYDNTVYKSAYTGAQIDAGIANALNALLVTGGTMTGPLILSGNPTEPLGAVTKQYLETKLGEIELTPGPPGSPGAPGVGIIDITIEEVV